MSVQQVFDGERRWGVAVGDCTESLREMPAGSVQCCVTSPPYFGLRDYGHAGQIGLEPTPDEFVAKLVAVFREVRRVLADDGTCWVNLGDTYNAYNGNAGPSSSISKGRQDQARPDLVRGHGLLFKGLKPKDRLMIPARFALAAQADGWFLRDEIVWHKPNPMPESVQDRCTKSHEMIYLLAKSERYYFDSEAIQEPANYAGQMRGGSTNRYEQNAAGMDHKVYDTRNKRSVWSVNVQPFKGAHFATYPPELIRPCVNAGSRAGDIVIDPFAGSGTTLAVAVESGRRAVGCELNPKYVKLIRKRMNTVTPNMFAEV